MISKIEVTTLSEFLADSPLIQSKNDHKEPSTVSNPTSPNGCFLKWWYPQNITKSSLLVGKPMVAGYHHSRKPPNCWGQQRLDGFGARHVALRGHGRRGAKRRRLAYRRLARARSWSKYPEGSATRRLPRISNPCPLRGGKGWGKDSVLDCLIKFYLIDVYLFYFDGRWLEMNKII